LVVSALFSGVIFHLCGVYQPFRGHPFFTHFKRLVLGWISLAFVLSALVFLTKMGASFSREWFFEWMALGFFLSLSVHAVLWGGLKFLRSKGFNIRRILVIGSGDLVRKVCEKLNREKSMGYEIVQVWEFTEVPEDFDGWWSANHPDEIWIVVSLSEIAGLQDRLTLFRFSTANIRIIPDLSGLNILNYSMGQLQGMPVLTLRSTPMQGLNRVIKALEDKLISGLIVLLISPFLLTIALAVKLSSPGPIFYRQERVSLNNKTFQMLKFRSMPVDAESATGAVWAKAGENRATKVGAFLRKTSLDELPQFLNVLRGEMSIVGPRPERPVLIEQFKQDIPGYMQKHMVKAGITGWAQVNGWRGNTDLKKRIEYDLYYIEHWSLWFDLKIIFLTIFKGFVNKNAY
jgi:putative colanic acid biosynthesis UDP-glucose lipid carrier transferase